MNEHFASPIAWTPSQAEAHDPHVHAHRHESEGAGAITDLLRLSRRQSFGLGIWVAACLGFAAAYLHTATSQYDATAQVVLDPQPPVLTAGSRETGLVAPALDSAQADSQVQVIRSERVLRYVFDTLDLGRDPAFAQPKKGFLAALRGGGAQPSPEDQRILAFQAFSNGVGVSRIGQSYVLEISYRASDPVRAAQLANAVAAAYIRAQIQFRAASMMRGGDLLRDRLADIQAELLAASSAVVSGTVPDRQFADSDARIVGAALVPQSRSSPRATLILMAALIGGLTSGLGLLAIRARLDRTIRTRRQALRALGLDTLMAIPNAPTLAASSKPTLIDSEDSAGFLQALRALRTTLLASEPTARPLVIGIASWSAGEGRSTIALNLARVIAASRKSVVLVDADFRNPALSRALAPDATTGLDQILLGKAVYDNFVATIEGNIKLVPAAAGNWPPDQDGFIGSAEMRKLLQSISRTSDVLIDLPPLEISSETQAVGRWIDGVVLIAAGDRTKIDDLQEAERTLRAANTRVLSVVLNRAADRSGWLRRAR